MKIESYALITAMLGIVVLIVLSFSLEPKLTKISDINEKNIDQNVRIRGEISNIKTYSSITSFVINDGTEKIRVVSYRKINLTGIKNAEVVGKVSEWKGLIEIEASKISEITS